jgi:hypothetical protein
MIPAMIIIIQSENPVAYIIHIDKNANIRLGSHIRSLLDILVFEKSFGMNIIVGTPTHNMTDANNPLKPRLTPFCNKNVGIQAAQV